jgi:peptidoglycan hydrolase-like protein with peptidoglycan-binding domain
MATAGRGDLDPRQLKAREEFQKMREQLRRTQERTLDPALARDRMKERIAFYERDARLLRRPLAAIGGRRWWRQPATVAVLAFALGAVSTFAAMGVVLGRGAPRAEPPVLAALVADQSIPAREPAVQAAAAAPVAPPQVEPAAVAPAPEPEIVELAAAELPAAAVAEPPPVAVISPEDDEALVRIDRIRESQTLLAALGYVPGRADGDAGPQTLAAAAQFAAERGLADSNLDAAFLAALRAARAGALPVRGSDAGDETVVERVTRIREIQALLVAAGYDLGRPDGDAGPKTLDAAASYADERGLADANLDAAFLAFMREGAAG